MYSLEDVQLKRIAAMCDLRVVIDGKLLFVEYRDYVSSKALRYLSFLKR